MSGFRIGAPPVEKSTLDEWIRDSVALIFSLSEANQVILFGSALGDAFDRYSDLDFVVIFSTADATKAGQSALYRNTARFPCPVDFVCVAQDDYGKRSQIGGVLMIAREDGRSFLRPVG